ncbi:hypothetical protein L2E82_15775 [Cichorium intybus]|uniref:Uncharacterized protein n=1 Tax=Cichorium intybus TaxID=13427 RepID=A0ACB9F4A8_CICIN|nr:hypothetical protein L1887_35133 [Cichorium endivia]KAI3765733.1 hypothetical protein L2E82_15775 [Cichorium intybus]
MTIEDLVCEFKVFMELVYSHQGSIYFSGNLNYLILLYLYLLLKIFVFVAITKVVIVLIFYLVCILVYFILWV